jgi:hypothetical protein
MKKKEYMTPTMDVVEIEMMTLLAGSGVASEGTGDEGIGFGGIDEGGTKDPASPDLLDMTWFLFD